MLMRHRSNICQRGQTTRLNAENMGTGLMGGAVWELLNVL